MKLKENMGRVITAIANTCGFENGDTFCYMVGACFGIGLCTAAIYYCGRVDEARRQGKLMDETIRYLEEMLAKKD